MERKTIARILHMKSASKPYVELPPHTAPLGMEGEPDQACLYGHDIRNSSVRSIRYLFGSIPVELRRINQFLNPFTKFTSGRNACDANVVLTHADAKLRSKQGAKPKGLVPHEG